MVTAILLGLAVGLTLMALFLLALWGWTRWSDEAARSRLRRRVLVNLDTGTGFTGVLWSKTGDWLVLRNAEMLERDRAPRPMDGEVVLERSRVESVQVL